jgi:hypothetical protein
MKIRIKSPHEWADAQHLIWAGMPNVLLVIIALCAVELCLLFVCVALTGGNP